MNLFYILYFIAGQTLTSLNYVTVEIKWAKSFEGSGILIIFGLKRKSLNQVFSFSIGENWIILALLSF